ncbi:MAG TPA: PQQ-dependent sugar dehydrogenase [Pilimelia sp.]|nr:PQQ-dependent sugar dehydrogenase [Pilimelia sp.]
MLAALGAVAVWRGWFADPSVRGAPERELPAAAVSTVASGLRAPWGVAFLPPGTAPRELPAAQALVTERDTARILAVAPGGDAVEVARVAAAEPGGEGGLLGIALPPDYARGGWVYVYYTAERDNRIARLRLGGGAPEPVLTGIPKAGNHNGGRLAFGPDGMLYAGTGDAARRDSSQDRADLGGKILRLTPLGRPAPGNPFGDSPVYSYGHRNVQGLAWDAGGQLYASEFGQNTYDELNRIEPGRNYGWPVVEGDGDDDRYVDPVATWATDDASPSGIAVHGGEVWMACLRGRRLYRIGTDGAGAAALLVDGYGRLRDVARAPDGALWVLTSNHDGRGDPAPEDDRILRLTP